MKKTDIVRAWKDAEYRNSLSATERAALPMNPAGDLNDDLLAMVSGGGETATAAEAETLRTHRVFTWGCCCPQPGGR